MNFLVLVLEFKLTPLSQQTLCYKSFLELLVLYFPQENNGLEQSLENVVLASCTYYPASWTVCTGPSYNCALWGQAWGGETQQADEMLFLELTINYFTKRSLM